jgi:hypothetical protein
MATRAVFSVFVIGFGLAGCAPFHPDVYTPPLERDYISCASSKCDIEVAVTNCAEANGVSVNINALDVRGRNVKLLWKIVTPNYRFADIGIEINSNDPKREFNDPTRESDMEYSWKYKASPNIRKTYKYTVYVERVDPTATCKPLDPWVRN